MLGEQMTVATAPENAPPPAPTTAQLYTFAVTLDENTPPHFLVAPTWGAVAKALTVAGVEPLTVTKLGESWVCLG